MLNKHPHWKAPQQMCNDLMGCSVDLVLFLDGKSKNHFPDFF